MEDMKFGTRYFKSQGISKNLGIQKKIFSGNYGYFSIFLRYIS
jgi:hypothetical protein